VLPHRLPRLATALVAGIALLICSNAAAAAPPTPPGVQTAIDAQLAAHPGGTQVNATEISYNGGAVIITFAAPRTALAATTDCPSGSICVYDNLNYAYPRFRITSCGWYDLAAWDWNDRTESAYYNMSSGSAAFLDHGATASHDSDRILFTLSTSSRGKSSVYPYLNRVDHVSRPC
jgi:hypothetical protein